MQEVYRIIVKPYGYDHWDIFTEDKELFDSIRKLGNTDQVRAYLGADKWADLVDSDFAIPPYVLLGETTIHHRD
jgi:hypothetical protein